MQPGKDLLWDSGKGNIREGETCREKDETRKDNDDRRSMKTNSRGAVQEEEAGVVSPDSTNKDSSHL
jgi:hypothetical protein